MLLASADGQTTTAIATQLRCNDQTVRNAIHTFNAHGLTALQPKSSRPHTLSAVFDDHRRDQHHHSGDGVDVLRPHAGDDSADGTRITFHCLRRLGGG